MFAAFQRFVYQAAELEYAWETASFLPMARYFATKIVSYDFWKDTEMWRLVERYAAALQNFLSTGCPQLRKSDTGVILCGVKVAQRDQDENGAHRYDEEILELWRYLAALPRSYEDVCREWYLPTGLGYDTSYSKETV